MMKKYFIFAALLTMLSCRQVDHVIFEEATTVFDRSLFRKVKILRSKKLNKLGRQESSIAAKNSYQYTFVFEENNYVNVYEIEGAYRLVFLSNYREIDSSFFYLISKDGNDFAVNDSLAEFDFHGMVYHD